MKSQKPVFPSFCVLVTAVLAVSSFTYSQSGRRARQVPAAPPAPSPETNESTPKTAPTNEPPLVTAEKNQEYRCTEDGSLARIIEPDDTEVIVSTKDTDVRATITDKPKPSYTKEARRDGVQGFVTLKVLLSARGKIARVRVMKGLPAGLTANAIRAACKIEFKPAMKDGQAVSQWLTAEYVFRLADSSIFAP